MEHPTVLTTIPLNFELVRIGPQLKKNKETTKSYTPSSVKGNLYVDEKDTVYGVSVDAIICKSRGRSEASVQT